MTYKEFLRGKCILISGGAGAIGTNLVKKLALSEARLIIILDDLSSSYRWNIPRGQNILFVEGSVTDEVILKEVFLAKPDIVYHLAALFANQNSLEHPEKDLLINGLGTLKMLEFTKQYNVDRFIYASSGCSIYGNSAPLPFKENYVSFNYSTPYQITKMLGELYSNFYINHFGMNIVKMRLFNSYGPGEVPGQYRNVIPNFIYKAMKGLPLTITGSGEETRDFCFVEDIVDAFLKVSFSDKVLGKEFNIASGRETRIIDLANMINKFTGNKAGVEYTERRSWDHKNRSLACIDYAKDVINYEPKVFVEEGVLKTINWFEENWAFINNSAFFISGK